MSDIASYVPDYYKGIKEINSIIDTENEELDAAFEIFSSIYKNQFIRTCDETGIIKFEQLLNILGNPETETLQFRIERVINRLTQNPPYTLQFLKVFLDGVLGKNSYKIYTEGYNLILESSSTNQSWFEEIVITINNIKPCNIIFKNKPLIRDYINVNEKIYKAQTVYTKIGSWKLGSKPFIYKEENEMVKSADTLSINDNLVNYLAQQLEQKVNYVKLNNSKKITDFTLKSTMGNQLTIEYNVMTNIGITEITNVKLYDSEDNILTNTNLYIPVSTDTVINHTIQVKEGQ